jgi:hypothetical protein
LENLGYTTIRLFLYFCCPSEFIIMPPKNKASSKAAKSAEEDALLNQVDVKYNPEIITSALAELKKHVDNKCQVIKRDTDFLVISMQEAFHLEMIKLPTNVKQMSMKQFREEFNFSLEAVTQSLMTKTTLGPNNKPLSNRAFETPSANRSKPGALSLKTPGTVMRPPREGEIILSANGSPLGEFLTVKKAPRPDNSTIIPPTPGVFVPLRTGEIVDLDNIDIENMPEDMKMDTLQQMETMMQNMRMMMEKLQGTGGV